MRRPQCLRARRASRRGGERAERVSRRQQSTHAKSEVCARHADRPPDRRIFGRRICCRSASCDRRADRREPRACCGSGIGDVPAVDAALWGQVPVLAARNAATRPYERVFPRRRQGADEQLLRGGRASRRPGVVQRGSRRVGPRRRLVPIRVCADRRPPRQDAREGGGPRRRGLRVEPRLAEGNLGRRRGQLHHPRDTV